MPEILLRKIKYILSLITVAVLTVFCCLPLLGCNDNLSVEDAANIARESFGCTKILWMRGTRTGYMSGNDLPGEYGYYVVGVDESGNEIYVVVPNFKSKRYSAETFDWRFDYTFGQIAEVFTKYGYKYADGIDGRESEYFYTHMSTYIGFNDDEETIKHQLDVFGDAEKLYEELDVKVMFDFFYRQDGGVERDCFLVQTNGSLMLYEIIAGDLVNFNVTVYNKDNI